MSAFRLFAACILGLGLVSSVRSDETHARYFEQLRQRGLFSLAESDAISRLADVDLPLAARTSFTIELSRTLTEHAGFVSDEQRDELWQRARSCVQDLLNQDRMIPRSVLLQGQLASVFVSEGEWLRAECALRPFDDSLRRQSRDACSKAIEQLKLVETALSDSGRDTGSKKPATPATGHELRTLLHQVRFSLGQSYRNRGELFPSGSPERTSDLKDAEQSLQRIIGVADEPLQSRAKVLQVVCARLRNNLEKAAELLAAFVKAESKPIEVVENEMLVERVRLLIDLKRQADAVELLLKIRGQRQRLTGELWFLQVHSLIALREIAIEKRQETLADRLAEQVVTTIDRCEEQVGGYWGRRCRQLWDNAQTAQKYGAELDALMQQARSDYTAGRIDAALTEYAAAEKMAVARSLPELAGDLGFTRASILLDQQQFEPASNEFLRLSKEFTDKSRAAKAHLLGAYCLGRIYDQKKTQSRREAYTDELDRHIKDYSSDQTVGDARYLKAQLEEQRLQATAALALFLAVTPDHPRALDAMAGVARCSETILRRMQERRMNSEEFEQETINRLSSYLAATGETSDQWTITHADIALRLVAILLRSSNEIAIGNEVAQPSETLLSKEPPFVRRAQEAARWLARVEAVTDRKDLDVSTMEILERLRERMVPLKIVAYAGCGKLDDADRLLKTLAVPQPQSLAILEQLSQVVTSAKGEQQVQRATWQLKAVERLIPSPDQLSPTESDRLNRCLIHAYAFSGQTEKAVAIGRHLSEQAASDTNRQRELAILFTSLARPDGDALAKQCWRRVESQTKAGSPEWINARLGILATTVRLKQFDEARKLLQVTKVLYPNLGGETLKPQFEALEKELQSAIHSKKNE